MSNNLYQIPPIQTPQIIPVSQIQPEIINNKNSLSPLSIIMIILCFSSIILCAIGGPTPGMLSFISFMLIIISVVHLILNYFGW